MQLISAALLRALDLEWAFIDATYARAYQHSTAAAAGPEPQAIGKRRAGLTTKLHLAVDAYGLPSQFEITGGQLADCTAALELIVPLSGAEALVGDKRYDSARIRK